MPRLFRFRFTAQIARTAAVTGLLTLFVSLMAASALRDSPTADEPLHLVRGLAYWWTGDTQLSYAHPPLVNALETLPVALLDEPWDFTRAPGWSRGEVERVNRAYLTADYEQARAQIIASRFFAILFALLLAIYVYRFCRDFFDTPTAVAALAAVCLNPTIIAHGHLITTDVPASLGIAVALGEGIRYLTRSGWRPLLTFSGGVALAACTKYNVVLLVPVLLGAGVVAAHKGWGRFAAFTRAGRYARLGGALLVVTTITCLAVGATYRFQRFGLPAEELLALPEPENGLTRPYGGRLLETTLLPHLPDRLPVPVPQTYLVGVASVSVQTHIKGHGPGAFFAGKIYNGHNPAYFPVLLLLKTPLPLWVLVFLGAAWLVQRRFRISAPSGLLILFALLFLLAASTSKLNVGVRHVLPVIPILSILAGRVVAHLCALAPRRTPRWLFAAAAAAALLPLAAHPHHLSYFNFAVGRALGHEISIVGEDWGQDVGAFAQHLREERRAPLFYLNYAYSHFELKHGLPGVRGIRCNTPKPRIAGWIAVHAALWRRAHPQKCMPWLQRRTPDEVFNHHLYLFRWPQGRTPR